LRSAAECTPATARTATRALESQLRRLGARLVPASRLRAALREVSPGARAEWTPERAIALGRATAADRVLVGQVRLQAMVRAKGDVWEIEVHQYDVSKGALHGSFKRVSAFGRAHGLTLLPAFAKRILDYDPSAPTLTLKNPAPMKTPDDAPRQEGMVYIPAGELIMGSDRGETDEEPRHVVHTDAFWIDTFEVTNASYDACVAARQCRRSAARGNRKLNGPRQPVVGVGFDDAVAYCRFAGKRVLTEAEWEKAARGSDERTYPWGNDWHPRYANLESHEDGHAYTAPVGSFPKGVSPYGVHDMAGNAWEWTSDVYDPGYYARSPARNPKGPASTRGGRARRVMRGGSWMYDVPFFVATHNRSPGRPWIRKMFVGIRCGKSAPPIP
jgi:iron(II)-dependent oxidoreductase